MEVIVFKVFCEFCTREYAENQLKRTLFGEQYLEACEECRKFVRDKDNEFFIQRRKEIAQQKAKAKAQTKLYRRAGKRRRARSNPYTGKKNCKYCDIWIYKSSWKNHNVSKKHAKKVFERIELEKMGFVMKDDKYLRMKDIRYIGKLEKIVIESKLESGEWQPFRNDFITKDKKPISIKNVRDLAHKLREKFHKDSTIIN